MNNNQFTDPTMNFENFFDEGVIEKSRQTNPIDDMYFNIKSRVVPDTSTKFCDMLLQRLAQNKGGNSSTPVSNLSGNNAKNGGAIKSWLVTPERFQDNLQNIDIYSTEDPTLWFKTPQRQENSQSNEDIYSTKDPTLWFKTPQSQENSQSNENIYSTADPTLWFKTPQRLENSQSNEDIYSTADTALWFKTPQRQENVPPNQNINCNDQSQSSINTQQTQENSASIETPQLWFKSAKSYENSPPNKNIYCDEETQLWLDTEQTHANSLSNDSEESVIPQVNFDGTRAPIRHFNAFNDSKLSPTSIFLDGTNFTMPNDIFSFDENTMNFTDVVKKPKKRVPKCTLKIVENIPKRKKAEDIFPKQPAKPRKKYERKVKPIGSDDVPKPRKKYVRKKKTDKITEDLDAIAPSPWPSTATLDKLESPLNFAHMGILANQMELLVMSPLRTRKFVTTRRNATASKATVPKTDNLANNDRVESVPIWDNTIGPNINLLHLMSVNIPTIKERGRSVAANESRRKQKLQIIPGADSFTFEILNSIETDSDSDDNNFVKHEPIVDQYPETNLPEVDEIFSRRRKDSRRKDFRTTVNIHCEDTLSSPPKKQQFDKFQPVQNNIKLMSPKKKNQCTLDLKRKPAETQPTPPTIRTPTTTIRKEKSWAFNSYDIANICKKGTTNSSSMDAQQPQLSNLMENSDNTQDTTESFSMLNLNPTNIQNMVDEIKLLPLDAIDDSFLCLKCGKQFTSDRALSTHEKNCTNNAFIQMNVAKDPVNVVQIPSASQLQPFGNDGPQNKSQEPKVRTGIVAVNLRPKTRSQSKVAPKRKRWLDL